MSGVVLDASVVASWLIPGKCTEAALTLLSAGEPLVAPGLLRHEIGASLAKRVETGEITSREARRVGAALSRLPIRVADSPALAEAAVDAARRARATYADGVYLALAAALGWPLVTADRELWSALPKERDRGLLRWVGDAGGV